MRGIRKQIILFLVAILLVLGISYPQQVLSKSAFPEIRGVWLTKNDTQILADQPRLESTLEELAQLNFNTVYPVVWNSGYVSYPSEVVKKAGIQSFVKLVFKIKIYWKN